MILLFSFHQILQKNIGCVFLLSMIRSKKSINMMHYNGIFIIFFVENHGKSLYHECNDTDRVQRGFFMQIRTINENGLYVVFKITDENQLKLLHFSALPWDG